MTLQKKGNQKKVSLTGTEDQIKIIKEFAQLLKDMNKKYPWLRTSGVTYHTHAHQNYKVLGIGVYGF